MANYVLFKKRFYQLLILSQNENSLFDQSLEERELSSYQIILSNQVFYNDRSLYISLIEEYLTENAGSAGSRLFVYEFYKLWRRSIAKYATLEHEILDQGISRLNNFSINSESKKFSELLEDIFTECQFKYEEEMTDDVFRWLIKNQFLEIKECLNSYTYNDTEVLQFVMIFFSVTTTLMYSFLKAEVFSF